MDELVKTLRLRAALWEKMYDEDYVLKQAADAIEELLTERDEVNADSWKTAFEIERDEHRWIPVTERLPKEGEFVLVYGDLYHNKHDGGVIAVSKRMDWNYWQGFGRERDITHWMPLPQPPKEG